MRGNEKVRALFAVLPVVAASQDLSLIFSRSSSFVNDVHETMGRVP